MALGCTPTKRGRKEGERNTTNKDETRLSKQGGGLEKKEASYVIQRKKAIKRKRNSEERGNDSKWRKATIKVSRGFITD